MNLLFEKIDFGRYKILPIIHVDFVMLLDLIDKSIIDFGITGT